MLMLSPQMFQPPATLRHELSLSAAASCFSPFPLHAYANAGVTSARYHADSAARRSFARQRAVHDLSFAFAIFRYAICRRGLILLLIDDTLARCH